jgi:hypothetical protein
MSDIYTLMQGQEPGLDGWEYRRVNAAAIITPAAVAVPELRLITDEGGPLVIPSGAAITQVLMTVPEALTMGGATAVLKAAAAVNTNATASSGSVASAAAESNILAPGVFNSVIPHGAPVILGSALTIGLFAATLANASGVASTVASGSALNKAVGVSVFYAVPRDTFDLGDTGFWNVKALGDALTRKIGPS